MANLDLHSKLHAKIKPEGSNIKQTWSSSEMVPWSCHHGMLRRKLMQARRCVIQSVESSCGCAAMTSSALQNHSYCRANLDTMRIKKTLTITWTGNSMLMVFVLIMVVAAAAGVVVAAAYDCTDRPQKLWIQGPRRPPQSLCWWGIIFGSNVTV